MKLLVDVSIVVAVAAILLAIVSRITFAPIAGLTGRILLGFANTLLLLSIAVILREKK